MDCLSTSRKDWKGKEKRGGGGDGYERCGVGE